MQLDFFNDNTRVALRNDVINALEQCDANTADSAWGILRDQHPGDEFLSTLQVLIDALAQRSQTMFLTHDVLRSACQNLQDVVAPAAQGTFASPMFVDWMRARWQELAQRAKLLTYRKDRSDEHAAALWLRAGNWQEAVDAVAGIESWRRIGAPLFWMVQARLHLFGLQANWGLLAELAWLSPHRLEQLETHGIDPALQQLMRKFELQFEGAGDSSDWAWFAAWLLTERPSLAPALALAQPSQHSDPETTMRVLIELLGLERQGRHHDIIDRRKRLRSLNAFLYGAYIAGR
jgi:hypothetical protein